MLVDPRRSLARHGLQGLQTIRLSKTTDERSRSLQTERPAPKTFSSSNGVVTSSWAYRQSSGALVEPPSQKDGRMPETIALHVIVFDLADTFDAKRFP